MPEPRAIRVRFRGHVQGVGFRAHVLHHCRAAGIVGWVRNLDDGSVEAELVGPQELLGATVQRIQAARAHQVSSVDQFEIPVPKLFGPHFEIRH